MAHRCAPELTQAHQVGMRSQRTKRWGIPPNRVLAVTALGAVTALPAVTVSSLSFPSPLLSFLGLATFSPPPTRYRDWALTSRTFLQFIRTGVALTRSVTYCFRGAAAAAFICPSRITPSQPRKRESRNRVPRSSRCRPSAWYPRNPPLLPDRAPVPICRPSPSLSLSS